MERIQLPDVERVTQFHVLYLPMPMAEIPVENRRELPLTFTLACPGLKLKRTWNIIYTPKPC